MDYFFSFEGRTNRWHFFLHEFVSILVFYGLYFLGFLFLSGSLEIIGWVIILSAVIFILWSDLAVMVRRFHDLDRPGSDALQMLIPLWSTYLGLLLTFKKGTEGPNQYGPEPD